MSGFDGPIGIAYNSYNAYMYVVNNGNDTIEALNSTNSIVVDGPDAPTAGQGANSSLLTELTMICTSQTALTAQS